MPPKRKMSDIETDTEVEDRMTRRAWHHELLTPSVNVFNIKELYLAFDIERTGPMAENETFAIGASVVTDKGEELAKYLFCCYDDKAKHSWEQLCATEFWSEHLGVLMKIEEASKHCVLATQSEPTIITKMHVSGVELRRRMIESLLSFIREWEVKASQLEIKIERVTDCPSYDVHWLNTLIGEYLPGHYPFPYTMIYPQVYAKIVDTGSFREGYAIAAGLDGHEWKALEDHTGIKFTKPPREHDHMPDNDAFTIAWKYAMLKNFRK